jgi:Sec-independent protein translocase protein TatA
MQRLLIVAFAALCLAGASSLALAEDAMMGEMDKMKSDIKTEKESMKADTKAKKAEMKSKKKEHKQNIKAKRHEMKEKTKAHRAEMKGKGEEHKDAATTAVQDMKASVPSAPAVPTTP